MGPAADPRSPCALATRCAGWRAAAPVAVVLLGLALVAQGCAGVFGFDGTSDSGGWHANGVLRHPSELRRSGDGYVIPPVWAARDSNFGCDELVGALVRATRAVSRWSPGSIAAIGDMSRRGGGGSVEHRSHQSGRDVDIVYFAVGATGRPVSPSSMMIHFDRSGRASRWSPPQGTQAPAAPVPDARFDVRRNWQLVRALLRDPDAEVQWIFMQRDLAARLIQEGLNSHDDPELVARAFQVLHQPSDSEPHDDHMHVRLYCDPGDRALGCVDRGPIRWWKKRWKYMSPPFGRPGSAATASELLTLLRTRIPLRLGRARLAS